MSQSSSSVYKKIRVEASQLPREKDMFAEGGLQSKVRAMLSERKPLDCKTLVNGTQKQSTDTLSQSAFLKKHPSVCSTGRYLESLQGGSNGLNPAFIGFGGPASSNQKGGEMGNQLQLHPLNMLIKEFQQKRTVSQSIDEKKVSVTEFLDAFTTNVRGLEAKQTHL